ncbi:hypothetical protein DLM75_20555 [Leptospira stimsonii]|uniref:Uncharacterized protein n=1 Tax=Leptospira stimsonii TaxID=2202203 RepID=A0A396YSN2_9LEPT|nr:hypothetical protein DLM75_20555 [Leptospira stimsonii]
MFIIQERTIFGSKWRVAFTKFRQRPSFERKRRFSETEHNSLSQTFPYKSILTILNTETTKRSEKMGKKS